ncbi:hypothetical protein [Marinilabilia salmonicolor]|uniref:CpXC motif protein n=1 Tax=Marinilabilia salmonicolor TaxID=989 RepID=A0A368V6P2_9BACT|nr:hypothetical protein [Marinilabilia salmonicolor]RCW36759.1 hypothetical protein DFO77_10750 [Marinilabilia salmonicolor]
MPDSKIKGTHVEKEVECPMCHSFFTIDYFRPEAQTPSARYSDGQTDVTNILDPMPTTHCVHCGFFFSVYLNTHKVSETNGIINTDDFSKQQKRKLPEDMLKGYLHSVSFRHAIIPPEEFFLRIQIWWLLNNDKEASGALFKEYQGIWKENLQELISIIDYVPLNKPRTKAEALRNLGLYEQCMAFLDQVPEETNNLFVSRMRRECQAGNPHRVVL